MSNLKKLVISIIIIMCVIYISSCDSKITSKDISSAHFSSNISIGRYIRFNGRYYKLSNEGIAVDKISRKITANYYSIKASNIANSIALFTGKDYIKYTYSFDDTFYYNNFPYVINANAQGVPNTNELLENVQQGSVYQSQIFDNGFTLVVKIGNTFFPSYQIDSQIVFKNNRYDLLLHLYDPNGLNLRSYLGQAGSYKIYKDKNSDNSILILIRNKYVAEAHEILI